MADIPTNVNPDEYIRVPDEEYVYRASIYDTQINLKTGILKRNTFYPTSNDGDGLSVFRASRIGALSVKKQFDDPIYAVSKCTCSKIREAVSPISNSFLDVLCTVKEEASGDPHAVIRDVGIKVRGQEPSEEQKAIADQLHLIFTQLTENEWKPDAADDLSKDSSA